MPLKEYTCQNKACRAKFVRYTEHKYCSRDCARIKSRRFAHPSNKVLQNELDEHNMAWMARKYGVSPVAIKKLLVRRGILDW